MQLNGHVAVVTGASSGIGRSLAVAIAEAGAAVVVVARRADRLAETVALVQEAGGRAHAVACDLTDREAFQDLKVRLGEPFGGPDLLVNAAGLNPRRAGLETSLEDWDRTLALNLTAPFLLAQLLVPDMLERRWGRVLNIASLQSERAFPNGMAYGASKGGIAQLTRAMAREWSSSGVNCNALAPGFFPTELTAQVFENEQATASLAARTCTGRNGKLEDLHGAALFLLSMLIPENIDRMTLKSLTPQV